MYHKRRENSSHLRQLLLSFLTLVKITKKSISSNLTTNSQFIKQKNNNGQGQRRWTSEQAFFGTHAVTETVHRTVSILRIAFFESLFFTSKKEASKMMLLFLAQKERLAHRKLKLSSARTQAPKQSTGLFLFFELPCSILCSLHQKRKYRKTILPFLAQKERLELSRRLPDLRP